MSFYVYSCSYVIGQKHIIYGQNTNQLTITLKTTWNSLIACAPRVHEVFFFLFSVINFDLSQFEHKF